MIKMICTWNRTIILFFLLVFSLSSFAGKADSSLIYQFDVANRFIWRGEAYNASPLLQGTFGYCGKYLNVYTIGAYSVVPDQYHEIDLAVEVKPFPFLLIGAMDYFGLNDTVKVVHEAFNINSRTTIHILDAYVIYKNPGKYPFSLTWSTFVFGNDRDANGNNRFSSYVELQYPFFTKSFTISPFVGGAPYKGFYSNKPAIVNSGIKFAKTFQAGKNITLPSQMSFVVNPYLEKVFLQFMIGLE